MACVTLKRPLEFDPIHSSPGGASSCSPRPQKRRRCLPMCIPASHVTTPATTSLSASSFATLPRTSSTASSSYLNSTPARLQSDIAQYVREEIKRLKRLQMMPSSGTSSARGTNNEVRATVDMEESSSPSASPPRTSSPPLNSSSTPSSQKEKPLFSFRQVVHLCSGLLKDRDAAVRVEYERVLQQRKADQYDTFVRFTADQLHQHSSTLQQHSHERPTYLS